ncbi:MAG: STAS domain-containing protein [Acidimicrobiales bacterium]|jgi:anti-anti-sigma factor|nr:STAS domain-containing protein [Acidimicrobiales bacterium]
MALTDTLVQVDALERAIYGDTVAPSLPAERRHVAPVTPASPAPIHLAPAGRLDVTTARDLRDAAARAIVGRPGTLVIDLGAVTDLDAAGLAAVSHAALAARRAGIVCRVLAPRAAGPRRVLEMTGMDRLLLDRAAAGTVR